LGQWEQRIERFLFDQLFENLLGHFVVREARIDLDPEIGAAFPPFLARIVEPFRIDLANEIAVPRPSPWPSEVKGPRHVPFCVSMLDLDRRFFTFRFPPAPRDGFRDFHRQVADQFLHEVRHLLEIGVGPIRFEHRELWVVFS
jgi:hypothetical protein